MPDKITEWQNRTILYAPLLKLQLNFYNLLSIICSDGNSVSQCMEHQL